MIKEQYHRIRLVAIPMDHVIIKNESVQVFEKDQ